MHSNFEGFHSNPQQLLTVAVVDRIGLVAVRVAVKFGAQQPSVTRVVLGSQ
jgi:hypothetical protein